MTHRELCKVGAKYLRSHGIVPFIRCSYVVCELEMVGECPDAWGVGSGITQLIEVKVSRSDFLADKKKFHRIYSGYGLGEYRSYLCPVGLISESELPPFWGLMYSDEKFNITVIKRPESQPHSKKEDMTVLMSIMRREGIKPKVYSYKNYNSDQLSIKL